jgi:thioredoxin 1
MKKIIAVSLLLLTFRDLASFSFLPTKTDNVEFYEGTYDNLIREAKKQKKAILLDFWATWCNPCLKLDKETFSDKELGNYIKNNFLIYKVDIGTLDGMQIMERFSIGIFPTLIVFDPKSGLLRKFKGFYAPDYLQKELEKIQSLHNLYPPKSKDVLVVSKQDAKSKTISL